MKLKKALTEYNSLVLDFYSEDCPPCIVQEEILLKLQKEEPELLSVLQVDRKKNPEIFAAFSVTHLPHIKYFRNGKPIWENTGILDLEEIKQRIKRK